MISVDTSRLCTASALMLALTVSTAIGCGGHQRPKGAAGARGIGTIALVAAPEAKLTVDTDTLRDGLALELDRRNGEPFERYRMLADRDRLRGWLVRHGYFLASVTADSARLGDDIAITFEINEGPRARVLRVDITGLPDDVPVDAVRDLLPLDDGAVFDYETYDLAKPELLAVLERAGYAHAKLKATVRADQARPEAVIALAYTAGVRATFGAVTLNGTEGELASAARARMTIAQGERYDPTALANTRTDLLDMGRFAAVRVEPTLEGDNAIVPVAITVVESTRHELRLGGGFGMDPATYEVRGRASYAVAAFPTTLTTSRVELQPALVVPRDLGEVQPRIELRTGIERLDLIWPRVRGDIEAAFAYRTFEAFTAVGPRIRLSLRAPLLRNVITGGVGWQLETTDFTNIDPAIDAALQTSLDLVGTQRVGFFEQSVVVDLRDAPAAPQRGLYAEMRAQEGGTYAAGAKSYVRLVPDLRAYAPLGPVVLAARARLGIIRGDAPTLQRFYGGGANGQRGFAERQLSPFAVGSDADGNLYSVVYGGAAQVDAGLELRFPLGSLIGLQWGGVSFLDGGDVTDQVSQLALGHLHWATGLGLRAGTIIGALRFDIGYRLNRTGAGEPASGDALAFHFSLGEAF